MASLFTSIGSTVISWVDNMGAVTIFFGKAFPLIFLRKQTSRIIEQVYHIGATTMGIVSLIGLFTGMVMSLQVYHALVDFGAEEMLGRAVTLGLIRELGPVMTAIMIIARAGSSMTAEIGILRISEQIDALYTMRIDPLGYLISPRIAASIISFPLLTALFDIVGIIGGYFSGVMLLGVNAGSYLYQSQASVAIDDIFGSFIKTLVFAVGVSTICCYQGYFTHMRTDTFGAKSVSLSTTSAVVLSCVLVLVGNYVMTSFLL